MSKTITKTTKSLKIQDDIALFDDNNNNNNNTEYAKSQTSVQNWQQLFFSIE